MPNNSAHCETLILPPIKSKYLPEKRDASFQMTDVCFIWSQDILCRHKRWKKEKHPSLNLEPAFLYPNEFLFFVKWMFWTYNLPNNGFIVCYLEKWWIQIQVSLKHETGIQMLKLVNWMIVRKCSYGIIGWEGCILFWSTLIISFICDLSLPQAVKGTMQRTCKCHGVSGSCTTQTCWLQLPEFREVGNYLKEKYHRAIKVDLLSGAGNSAASRGAVAETFNSISRKELVHLEDSPDYCVENRTLGLPGTEGRECLKKGKNLSKWEKRSCKRLCSDCGLAVEERRAETVSSCNCKFHWCCAVKCEQCRKTVTKYYCVIAKQVKNDSASRRKSLRLRKKH